MDLDSDIAKNFYKRFTPQLLWTILGVLLFVVVAGSIAWYKTIKDTERLLALNNQQLDNQKTEKLVTIFSHGGFCQTAKECESTITIEKDGDYVRDGKVIKTMSNSDLAELTRQINNADYAQIKSKEFTDVCPMAYDGLEVVYTFYVNGRAEVIASCTVAIDNDSPPFKLLNSLQLR